MSARFPITNPRIGEYLRSLTAVPHPVRARHRAVLRAMEAYAARHGFPIIGPLVGPALYQLARLVRAGRVFELGSGYGYSTVWFAQAVGPRGLVVFDSVRKKAAGTFLDGVLRRAEDRLRQSTSAPTPTPAKL